MTPSHKMQHGQTGLLAASRQVTELSSSGSTLCVDVPFVHYKQTARVQEVELPVEVTRVHVEKVEVQAPHEIPIIHPRELGVHQQTRRNIPTPVDVYTVQKYQLPRLRPKYYDVEVPIYVPRYVEVPIPSHFVAFNNEPLPESIPLGPPMQSAVTTAAVLANNQVYSLAQGPGSVDAAQRASQRSAGAGESNSAVNTPFGVHTSEKEGECSSDFACFFPSSATTGLYTSGNSCPSMRQAFFLTPSHKQNPAAPLDAGATLRQQKEPAATGAAQSDGSSMLEMPDVAGMQGVASLGRAASSNSISESFTDRAISSICSPSLVSADNVEIVAAEVQQLPEGEELHEAAIPCEEGRPRMVEIVA